MFGVEPRVGLTTSSLPSEVIKKLNDEDDLQKAIHQLNSGNSESMSSDVEEAAPSGERQILLARKEAHESLKKTG
ncbi:hypothetical protein NQ314_017185 [Rhamnusium bicolor]|uniref:Uncharacterized protein n=1 Tax=Rhamnusium bicolor TaxID=1586634 RepID=A0AAV8WU17_9CUCU|nr:hypothetical protein NQ314_017185 [Rhamnusium bicolor]